MINHSVVAKTTAIFVAVILAAMTYFLSLSQSATIAGALAVTVFAAILWISEVLPLAVTALLIPVGLAALGVFEPANAFNSFGNPVLFLVLGGYAIAVAFEINEVDQWIASHIMSLAGNKSLTLLIAIMLTSAVLSMVISNTATTALMLPVAVGILSEHSDDINLSRILLLGVAYGASIGGVTTLIGSSPNAIAAGLFDISFLEWLAYGLPVSVAMMVVAIPILWWTYKPKDKHITLTLHHKKPLSTGAKRTLIVTGFTLFLWLFGPFIANKLGWSGAIFSSSSVALIAVVFLILSGCINWKNLEQGIQWGVILLLGGGLSLGRGLTESGAADWLAGLLANSAGGASGFVILLIVICIAVFATELISNTAITAKLAPILMGLALHLGLESENLVVAMAIASSMAFMLPVATPPNAMVHATGKILQKDMMRVGFRLNIAAVVVVSLIFYFR